MKEQRWRQVCVVAGIWLCVGAAMHGQTGSKDQSAGQTAATVTKHAAGTFEVKLTPQAAGETGEDSSLGRFLLDKQFSGDLEGTSKGQMLTASTNVKGSGAYVAIERVSGTLKGREGSFTLQHSGTMTRGAPQLTITVVPDSGTDQLGGLTGTMTIKVIEGKHFYDFEYILPETP